MTDVAVDRDDARRSRWRIASPGTVLSLVAIVSAVVIQTGRLATSEVFYGDLSYHEGVARTMAAGNLNGEGPFVDLPSYYGGLFPLIFGFASRALRVDFNLLVSVVSWFAVVSIPIAFYALAQRLWHDHDRSGATAFVAVCATGVSGQIENAFVFGFLPGSANEWPLYPRDVALVLIVSALTLCAGRSQLGPLRLCATGLLLGAAVTTQFQFAAYGIAVVSAWVLFSDVDRRGRAVVVIVASATLSSVWWWLPRAIWTVQHGPLDLQSGPGIEMPPSDVLLNLGWLVFLAPLALLLDRQRLDAADRRVVVWVVALVPMLVFTVFVPDAGLITERRAWLFVGIPLVLLAGRSLARVAAVSRPGAALLVLGMLATATLDMQAVLRFRDQYWVSSTTGGVNFPDEYWDGPLDALRSRVYENGTYPIIAGDADGLVLWTRTGAQPFSAWLPAWAKVGFDLESVTGTSIVDRARIQEEAFREGLPGLCGLADEIGAESMVLRTDPTGVAFHDLRPASLFRQEYFPASADELTRSVGDGLTYRNGNVQEALHVAPEVELDIPMAGTDVVTIEVRGVAGIGVGGTARLIVDGADVQGELIDDGSSKVFRFSDLDLVGAESVTFRGSDEFAVIRILGFAPTEVDYPAVRDGVVIVAPSALC